MSNREIADFFDKIATQYNDERLIRGGRLFNEFIEIPATKSLLGKISSKTNVLDIGCGIGAYAKYFGMKGANVVGIDVSQKMLDIAQENCKDFPKILLEKTSFENFKSTKKFDIIVGGFMLSYFQDLNPVFKKIRKRLKDKNSYAVLSMLHPVRLSASKKSKYGFLISDYFDENDYHTDLGIDTKDIKLKKWNFDDIVKSASLNKLYIDAILEPVPTQVNYEHIDPKLVTFYHKCPSVIVFRFKKL